MWCEDKVLDVIRDLEAETRHEAIFFKLDLANLASVKRYAEESLRYVYFILVVTFPNVFPLPFILPISDGRRSCACYSTMCALIFSFAYDLKT